MDLSFSTSPYTTVATVALFVAAPIAAASFLAADKWLRRGTEEQDLVSGYTSGRHRPASSHDAAAEQHRKEEMTTSPTSPTTAAAKRGASSWPTKQSPSTRRTHNTFA